LNLRTQEPAREKCSCTPRLLTPATTTCAPIPCRQAARSQTLKHGSAFIFRRSAKKENEEDFKFFGRLCTLERAALTIYDGKLIAAYEPYLEAIEPAITIDTTGCHVECEDNSVLSYGSTTVSCGPYTGTYKAPGENSRIWVPQKPIKCQSTLEAIRFAAGVLREKNKMLVCGSIEASLMPIYAPGIMVNILNQQAPSWSGAFYIYKVRHDYGKHKTKIFFRKKLEGY